MDDDHERLGVLVAGLNAIYERGGSHSEAVELMSALSAESCAHFRREEEHMERVSYPLAAVHREEHASLLAALQAIVVEFQTNRQVLDDTLLHDLWEWVNHHVTSSDRAFADYLAPQP